MLNTINKIIKVIGKKYLLLLLLFITTAVLSFNSFAMEGTSAKLSTDSEYVYTYRPPGTNGDYVKLTYKVGTGITYKGIVTLTNGCKRLTQNSLNYINYFVAPGPNDPILSFNLNVTDIGGNCTQSLESRSFSGELKPIDFSELKAANFGKYITFNWSVAGTPLPPVEIDYSKLKWEESGYEYIASNNYRFFLKTTYSRTLPKPGDCLSYVTYFGGSSCKTVEIRNYNKKNNVVTIAKDAKTLRKYFGPVDNISKAHFVADALRTQLWDRGEAKMNNKYFIRVNNECTKDATYYELVSTPTTYEIKFIKQVVGGYDGPALCT